MKDSVPQGMVTPRFGLGHRTQYAVRAFEMSFGKPPDMEGTDRNWIHGYVAAIEDHLDSLKEFL